MEVVYSAQLQALRQGMVSPHAGDPYIRHDEAGDREVARDAYAAEIETRQERPNTRFVVYDHTIEGDRARSR